MTKSNKTVTNPYLTVRSSRAEAFCSERSSSPCCAYFCRTIHGAVSSHKATELLQNHPCEEAAQIKALFDFLFLTRSTQLTPSTGENYENQSHAIKQQIYSNGILVPP